MKRRCPSAQTILKAVLENYEIAFVFKTSRWGKGGVAGIVPSQGSRVEGVVYKISMDDLKKLDKIELVHKNRYFRNMVKVCGENGVITDAWAYFPNRDIVEKVSPSVRYLKRIIEGAYQHQLSHEYIKKLESMLSK
jgi:gamma-glutamylcyclotransferase (GGCT)/AIG2-like uncharacterized protein YtfP